MNQMRNMTGYGQQPRNTGIRSMVPEDVFNQHFSRGQCFACSADGHSYRNCPRFPGGQIDLSSPCRDCKSQNIIAYHKDCGGRNLASLQSSPEKVGSWKDRQVGQGKVDEIQSGAYYPEEGNKNNKDAEFAVPVYVPASGWTKNE